MADRPNPQGTEFADRPGAYRLVIRTPKAEIDPGELIILEIYISGYGTIRGAKVLYYPSPNSGMLEDTQVRTGALSMSRGGVIVHLQRDVFADHDEFAGSPDLDVSAIRTESLSQPPPIKLHLQTGLPKRISPGIHNFQVFLTYFNGSEWQTDSQSTSVVVRNWFQRHYYITWGAGILGVVLALIGLAATLIGLAVNIGANWDVVLNMLGTM